MFEPENDIERLLMRASAEPAERPAFARALMDAEVVLVLVPEAVRSVPGPDGNAVIPEGTKMSLPSAVRGEERLIPFFTATSGRRPGTGTITSRCPSGRATVRPLSRCAVRAQSRLRLRQGLYAGRGGADAGGRFRPSGPQAITTQAPQQIMLAHPKEIPTALIEALAREFAGLKSVRGAWLMLAMRAGESEQSWMLGVDHNGAWQEVRDAIGRAVVGDILGGRMLDAKPLDGSSLAVTLRTGIPVTAAKRGFLH